MPTNPAKTKRRQERHRITLELPRDTWTRLKVRAAEETAQEGRFVSMGAVAARAVVAAQVDQQ